MRREIILITVMFLVSGCATITGPSVSQEEVLKAQEELAVKALGFRLKQLEKVNNIGYRIISRIPQEEVKAADKPQPYLGIYVSEISKYLKKLYGLQADKGLVVISVISGSPAEKAGVLAGDVLLAADKKKFSQVNEFNKYSRQLSVGKTIDLQIRRKGLAQNINLSVGSVPVTVLILTVDAQEVNAVASSSGIYVTYGLINFVKSDDELAAVLCHELAHFVRGHLRKAQMSSLLSLLIGIPLGIIADEAAPGSGDLAMHTANIFNAHYSRDLEKEADYFGMKFMHFAGYNPCVAASFQERFAIEIPQSMIRNYLSTHPSSPERMLRIQKGVEEVAGVTCP
ncbi:M48 family metalloprotease [Candidatus Omnitrophota bacterium]